MNGNFGKQKRARRIVAALFFIFTGASCSLLKERPIQLMSDTSAALKAAKEVRADSLAPDLYRRATDAFFRAQNEYRLKNFAIAETYAKRAKNLAEAAEFEALRQGSDRTSLLPPEEPVPPPPPSDIEPPQGQLATEAMRREAEGQTITPGGNTPGAAAQEPAGSGASTPNYPAALAPTPGSNFPP